ncbi:MAG: alcohol dehydrogenase catalytic domain-containing protein [Spirochaetia bacterium]|jgi:threonine dehydrogenase-like Zn-dependent dehydrogenase
MEKTMKAVRIRGRAQARYEEVLFPVVTPNDVLIRIRAVGICGTDLELYDGTMFYLTSGQCKLPMIPGHEWAGDVVEVGSNVTEFQIGEKVTGECSVGCMTCSYCLKGWYSQCPNRTETGVLNRDGGFAEYISFPKYFLHKCNRMKYEEAAFIEPTGIALYPTKTLGICPEDVVGVIGPGPIGLFAIQTARAYGARKIILFGTDDHRLAVGTRLGADATVNVRTDNVVQKVRAATDGHMVDAVIEAVGKPGAWETIPSILAPRARVAVTGLYGGKKCVIDFDTFVVNNITIYGSLGGPNVWDEAISLHERGLVTAEPLITHRMPLAEFAEGLDIVRHRKDNALKVILEP